MLHRLSPSVTWNLCHSENWTVVPLPEMLLEWRPLVFQRMWAWAFTVHGILGGKQDECRGGRGAAGSSRVAVYAGIFCSEYPRTRQRAGADATLAWQSCRWQKPAGN